MPIWFGGIVVFDHAIADFQEQTYYASVRADLAKSNQEQDADQRQEIKRTFYVDPDKDGNVTGRISTMEISGISPIEQQLKVVLLKHGQEIATAQTDAGQFILENVPTGETGETYTLVASGPNGFLAYAIHVRPVVEFDLEDARNNPLQDNSIQYVSLTGSIPSNVNLQDVGEIPLDVELQEEGEIQEEGEMPSVVEPQDEGEIPSVVELQDEGKIPLDVELQDEGDFQIEAAAIPPTFLELERIVEGYLPADIDLANAGAADDSGPQSNGLEIEGSFEYSLDEDGSFSGRVLLPSESRDLSDLNVFLLQDDEEKGQDDVDANGEFKFKDVEEGVYALVAAGKDGFAALSVKLVAADGGLSRNPDNPDEYYVSLRKKRAKALFNVAIIVDPCDICYCRQTIRNLNAQQMAMADFPPPGQFSDGFGGATSGGLPGTIGQFPLATGGLPGAPGGFSGGIGGRGLLRLAALATAITLPIALSDGTTTDVPPDMSPIDP